MCAALSRCRDVGWHWGMLQRGICQPRLGSVLSLAAGKAEAAPRQLFKRCHLLQLGFGFRGTRACEEVGSATSEVTAGQRSPPAPGWWHVGPGGPVAVCSRCTETAALGSAVPLTPHMGPAHGAAGGLCWLHHARGRPMGRLGSCAGCSSLGTPNSRRPGAASSEGCAMCFPPALGRTRRVTLPGHSHHLTLAPIPGISPLGADSSALIPVLDSCWSHLNKWFLPFLSYVFWIVFSSIQIISTFSMTCIKEAPFICIYHI